MRVIALIASHGERRFIGPCLEHLHEQGVESYLIDNGSTDETVEITEGFFGRGLIGIEKYPREDVYDWRRLLQRKEELAEEQTATAPLHRGAPGRRLRPCRDRNG